MCYAGNCNPECGKCTPKRLLVVRCPQCDARNEVSRVQYLNYFDLPHKKDIMEKKLLEKGSISFDFSCHSCGMDLEQVYKDAMPPKPCKRMGIICGYPCGRCEEEPTDTNRVCNTMVPLEKI